MLQNQAKKLTLSQESVRNLSRHESQTTTDVKRPNVSFTCPIPTICKPCA
jgi:hypothetical protein